MEYKEFRGVEGLVIAKLLTDDSSGITWDTPRAWAGVREITKSTEIASESKYYDNIAAIVVQSEGADEITLTCSVVDLEMDAYISGKTYDADLGAYIDGESQQNYFAIGYKTKDTKGAERYVWRYKGTISKGDETYITEDDGTESNGVEYTFTGIKTTHAFTKGGRTKALIVDTSLNLADVSTFFTAVTTPDTLVAKTAYTLSITQAANTTVTVKRNGVTLSNNATIHAGDVLTISVTGGTITVNGTAFTSGNTHTVAANVAVVSTATQG